MARIIIFCYFLAITVTVKATNCTIGRFGALKCSNVAPTLTFNPTTNLIDQETWILAITDSKISTISTSFFQKFHFLTTLALANAGVEEISPGAFDNLYRLKYFSLNDNSIKTLHAGSLHKDLWTLNLSRNNISKIEDNVFSGMKHVARILLEHNQLEEFKPGFIEDCRSLNGLDASHNKIRIIKSNTFSSNTFEIDLHYLDLSHNEVSEIDENSFQHSHDVNLCYNHLSNLRDYTFSRSFSRTKFFDVSNNRIKTIEKNALHNAPHFKRLDLSYNELSDLKNGSLCGIDSLTDLDISHNYLTEEDLTLLIECSKLEYLYISHNKIKHLEKNPLKNSTLKVLNLSHNEVLDLDLVALSRSLYTSFGVFLRNNNLKTLRGRVFNISALDLSHNKIETIESKSFKDKTLNTLDLSNNEIIYVATEVFECDLETLDLQYNKIKSFRNWFSSYHEVYISSYLNVSHNEIEQVETGAVSNNYRVCELDLSYNKISKIATNAFNSTTLERLHLDHNSLTVLQADIFNCSLLHSLNISFNSIKTVESGVFKDLNSLRYLDLSHNEIQTLDHHFFANVERFWGTEWLRINLEHNNQLNKTIVEGFLYGLLKREDKPSLSVNTALDQQSCQYFNNKEFDDRKQTFFTSIWIENQNKCVIEFPMEDFLYTYVDFF